MTEQGKTFPGAFTGWLRIPTTGWQAVVQAATEREAQQLLSAYPAPQAQHVDRCVLPAGREPNPRQGRLF